MEFNFKETYNITDLLKIMEILRSENGCPWDKVQTHHSIRNNFLEETYEVAEAIDENNPEMLKEELGDVLLQIVFHSQMEKEMNSFSFYDVVDEICKKLIVRHPHIFSDTEVSCVEDVLNNWTNIKMEQKNQHNISETLHSVPKQFPALMRAQKVQSRVKKINQLFGYSDINKVLSDLKSEINELEDALANNKHQEEIINEVGDILFSACNVSGLLKFDAEEALSKSTNKFISRISLIERIAKEKHIDLYNSDADELDFLWNEAKLQLTSRGSSPHEYKKQ